MKRAERGGEAKTKGRGVRAEGRGGKPGKTLRAKVELRADALFERVTPNELKLLEWWRGTPWTTGDVLLRVTTKGGTVAVYTLEQWLMSEADWAVAALRGDADVELLTTHGRPFSRDQLTELMMLFRQKNDVTAPVTVAHVKSLVTDALKDSRRDSGPKGPALRFAAVRDALWGSGPKASSAPDAESRLPDAGRKASA